MIGSCIGTSHFLPDLSYYESAKKIPRGKTREIHNQGVPIIPCTTTTFTLGIIGQQQPI